MATVALPDVDYVRQLIEASSPGSDMVAHTKGHHSLEVRAAAVVAVECVEAGQHLLQVVVGQRANAGPI